jgi:hypothetical protein
MAEIHERQLTRYMATDPANPSENQVTFSY